MFAHVKGTQSGLYPGVKEGMEGINSAHGIGGNFVKPLVIADLPLSFALDTALLPVDILRSAFKGKKGQEDKHAESEAPQPKPTPKP